MQSCRQDYKTIRHSVRLPKTSINLILFQDLLATGVLARTHCIRELLDVRDGVIDIPGLDIDEVLTTIYEICCNWFSLCIICKLF